jgi:hypothetical protein
MMSALNNILAKEWTVFSKAHVVPFEFGGLECMAIARPRLFHEDIEVGKSASIVEVFDVSCHVCVVDVDTDLDEMESTENHHLIFAKGLENLLKMEIFKNASTVKLDGLTKITLPGELKRTAVEYYCSKMEEK